MGPGKDLAGLQDSAIPRGDWSSQRMEERGTEKKKDGIQSLSEKTSSSFPFLF